ncbi:MAG: hypothetical protein MUD08_05865 [Cytophagales bacterium]|nr:hypothetical protein [Cytophagales bacterium]
MSFLHLLICSLTHLLISCQQVTVVVKDVPDNTPPGAALFVSGNFNHWDPSDRTYALRLNPTDSTYSVTLPKGSGPVEYRFTRGDWTTVEADPCGNPLPVRRLVYGAADTVRDAIPSWRDLGPTRCDQVTVVIDKLPANTPRQAPLYIAGNFNNWQAADARYRLRQNAAGRHFIRLTKNVDELEFKFTRGSWDADEVDAVGNPIPNRTFVFGQQDTLRLEIPGWKDLLPPARLQDRVTVLLAVPRNTPDGDRIFLAGNFNNWNPHDPRYELRWIRNWTYTLNLPRKRNHIEFKFTRGDWTTVETDQYGNPIENRNFTFGRLDTLRLEVKTWEDVE